MEVEEGSAICYACEDDFQAFLRERYPWGQCQTCGAEYAAVTCQQGKVHVVAAHVEGACGQWSDAPYIRPEDVAAGYCWYGCRPALPPRPVAVAAGPDDLDWLPF
jgi:hypothetical protein